MYIHTYMHTNTEQCDILALELHCFACLSARSISRAANLVYFYVYGKFTFILRVCVRVCVRERICELDTLCTVDALSNGKKKVKRMWSFCP